ncbi:MAG: HEAT repeat domain-containing protein, partial [Actinomycetota bacterium]
PPARPLTGAALRARAEAPDGAVRRAGHDLPRVRATALRMLGRAGDTEHVAVVRAGLEDRDEAVRRAAALALERMVERLDLPGEQLL